MSVDWKQEERISDLENMSIETSQTEMQRERERERLITGVCQRDTGAN